MAADDSDAYRFHHILIRDTAYNALLKRARATLHERFVEWAEQVNRERDREQEFEEILGYHLEQAFRYRSELGPIDAEGRAIGAGARNGSVARGAVPWPAATSRQRRTSWPEQSPCSRTNDPQRIELLVDLGNAQLDRGTFAEALASPRRGRVGRGEHRGRPARGTGHPEPANR